MNIFKDLCKYKYNVNLGNKVNRRKPFKYIFELMIVMDGWHQRFAGLMFVTRSLWCRVSDELFWNVTRLQRTFSYGLCNSSIWFQRDTDIGQNRFMGC